MAAARLATGTCSVGKGAGEEKCVGREVRAATNMSNSLRGVARCSARVYVVHVGEGQRIAGPPAVGVDESAHAEQAVRGGKAITALGPVDY